MVTMKVTLFDYFAQNMLRLISRVAMWIGPTRLENEFVAMLSASDEGKADIALEAVCYRRRKGKWTLNKPYKLSNVLGVMHFEHDTGKSIEEMIPQMRNAAPIDTSK